VAVSFTSAHAAERPHGDLRPTALALAMLALYDLCFLVPPANDFFELVYLPFGVVALTAVVAVLWAALTVALWRTDVYTRATALIAGWRHARVPQAAD
jgi:hypothetical protein